MKHRGFAKRRDLNEPEIVAGLEAHGLSVVRIDQPCDLIVGDPEGPHTYLLEIKNPAADRGRAQAMQLTPKEKEFHASWKGQIAIVTTVEEALAACECPNWHPTE